MRAGNIKPPDSAAPIGTSFTPGLTLRAAWTTFADAFAAEAGSLGLTFQRFSVAKFIGVLIGTRFLNEVLQPLPPDF